MRTIRNNTKILIQVMMLTTLLFSYGIVFAQAPNPSAPKDYTVLSPLPGTTKNCDSDGKNCTTDLSKYLPGIFTLFIGVGAVSAFVVLTIYGFEYMLTDSLMKKAGAREMLENALWGLGLIIFAYIILNTINPALLRGSLNITPPTVAPGAGVVAGGACADCRTLSSLNLPSTVSGSSMVSAGLAPKLQTLNSSLSSSGILWNVTEAYPTTATHQDPCHNNGSCVDISVKSTVRSINMFPGLAQNAGLSSSFEVQTQAQKDLFIKQGVIIPITVNPGATGAHFHVK